MGGSGVLPDVDCVCVCVALEMGLGLLLVCLCCVIDWVQMPGVLQRRGEYSVWTEAMMCCVFCGLEYHCASLEYAGKRHRET